MLAVSYLQGDSPLMCAASDGHAEVVKQLVAYGADTAAKNKVAPLLLDSSSNFAGRNVFPHTMFL